MTTAERSHALHTVDLDLHPNEASDLLLVEADELLRARGWDLAFWTGVYLVGSHYGSKGGPLETERAFLTRFRESDLAGDLEGSGPDMQVARNKSRLHRAVNDAFGPELLAPGPEVRERFIERTRREGPRGGSTTATSRSTSRGLRSTPTARSCSGCATR